jgi:uroporphyrinogen decarboxylase
VAFGTVAETITHVRDTLEVMMPGGGYALSPSHALQDNSPTENVLAIYETARTAGVYG